MLKLMNASTFEIDDPDIAVDELLEQLDLEDLAKNTIGIIGCNLEFQLNGTVSALCEQLPFETIGSTTYISDVSGEAGEDQLSLLVLSSDDISFTAGLSESMAEDPENCIKSLFAETAEKASSGPAMGFVVGPYLLNAIGDLQVRALDEASGGIPFFGTIALDFIEAVRDPRVIFNGEGYSDRMAMVLLSGDFKPQFFVEAISEKYFLKQQALITASQGNLLMEVNNMPAVNYLETLGLAKDGVIDNIPLIPLSIDIGDGGRPTTRAVFASTPEGYVICGGDMPEKAVLYVGAFEPDDVGDTAEKIARDASDVEGCSVVLLFSCMGRNRALGLDPHHEIERIQETLGDGVPYLFMYSAGEICPVTADGGLINKAHNDSIIACAL